MLLSLMGCCHFLPSDLAFAVKGSVPQNTQCTLHLLSKNRDVYPAKSISGEFQNCYWLPFCKQQYTIKIVCDSNIIYEETLTLPGDIEYPYNIGEIIKIEKENP